MFGHMRRLGWPLLFVIALAGACGEEEVPPPPPPPTQLAIRVVDASTGTALAGAEVTLLELGETKVTDASGAILIDPIEAGRYSYRAQAAGYVLFPRPRRDVPKVTVEKEKTTSIEIAIEPRPMAMPGATLQGTVTKNGAPVEGALVVATSLRSFAAYSDKTGRYAILGIEAPNLYSVTAYLQSHKSSTVNSVNATVGGTASAELVLTEEAGATVAGQLIGGTGTSSVVIAHRETRYAIPGLVVRGTLGGAYSISGVPEGSFEVQAGLEDDGISYDTAFLLTSLDDERTSYLTPALDVTSGTSSIALDLHFAPAIVGLQPTETTTVATPPLFTWPQVQGANRYVVEVRTVLGQVIAGGFDNFERPIDPIQAPATMLRYAGPALTRGALYSWRIYALKSVTTGALFEIISASEELQGEFRVAR